MAAMTVAATVAAALPASALTLGVGGLGGSTLVHVQDCRTVNIARQGNYGFDFSSKATGPQHVETGFMVDGSMTLCYSLDVASLSSVNVTTWTDATLDALVASLLGETDASQVCSAIRLQVGPGVHGTVSATSHADIAVSGQPPVVWDHVFAKDVQVDNLGEDIMFKACTDTNGNVSAS
jgi:hypothetical protein